MYPGWLTLLGGQSVPEGIPGTQLSVFNCRLESNICARYIENSWKFRIKCPNLFYF